MNERRTFLFLQGCTSPFFARLGRRLMRDGHRVHRINFNVGDRLYWPIPGAWEYRDSAAAFPAYLAHKLDAHAVTDLIMLGDTRPLHQPALELAQTRSIRVHVVEEGYFRPNWITFEADGINGYSRLPRDPAWYRAAAQRVPEYDNGLTVGNPLYAVALHEIGYHLPNVFNPLFYPGYRTHRPNVSAVEFIGWGTRFARMPYFRRRDRGRIDRVLASGRPFYLLPLQINGDSQIRYHGGTSGMPQTIKRVINSFLRHAPTDAVLLIKNHPLDNGLLDYAGWIRRLQRRMGFGDSIVYVESGALPPLLGRARGVVTVNSSVGTSALINRCPTIALGAAIYALPGLTFQGSLDDFWQHAEPPDGELLRCFRNVVIHATQVNGGFYSRLGMELGVEHCAARLRLERAPLHTLLDEIGAPQTPPVAYLSAAARS